VRRNGLTGRWWWGLFIKIRRWTSKNESAPSAKRETGSIGVLEHFVAAGDYGNCCMQ